VAPNHRARRRTWSARSGGTEGEPAGSSAPWTRHRCNQAHAQASRRYSRRHRPWKCDRPRNRRRSCPATSDPRRVDGHGGDAPARGGRRGRQGFSDSAVGFRRGQGACSRRRSYVCSAFALGRRSDRPQTDCRTDGTTRDGRRGRIRRAAVRTSRSDPAARLRHRLQRVSSPPQRSNRTRCRCPASRTACRRF
jgi:hypothetical protein